VTGEDAKHGLVNLGLILGYRVHWQDDSRRTDAGFPDVLCVGYHSILVFECKSRGEKFIPPKPTKKGRVMPGQIDWLAAFHATGLADSYVVRPHELDCETNPWGWQEISYDHALDILRTTRDEAITPAQDRRGEGAR
jgi:hypothetical protein